MATVSEILQYLDANDIVRSAKQTGEWMMVHCPFHGDGRERNASCGVLLRDRIQGGRVMRSGTWHCFACSTVMPMRLAINTIIKDNDVSDEAVKVLKEMTEEFENGGDNDSIVPASLIGDLVNKFAFDYIRDLVAPEIEYVPEEELQKYRMVVPYMYERKLTNELIEKFDVGYDGEWMPPGKKKAVPCITFPVRDETGKTLFVVRRSIEGKMYNYPEGVEKPVYGIYEIPPGTKSVIICESCINAITAYRYGKPAVALLGTGNQMQMEQLRRIGIREYVICTDGDDAGRRAAKKLKRELGRVAFVWHMPMPDGKDLNDLTEEEFNRYYEMRE
jgi:hypothetical protein